MTEERMLTNWAPARQAIYREYMRTTSAVIPWFKRVARPRARESQSGPEEPKRQIAHRSAQTLWGWHIADWRVQATLLDSARDLQSAESIEQSPHTSR